MQTQSPKTPSSRLPVYPPTTPPSYPIVFDDGQLERVGDQLRIPQTAIRKFRRKYFAHGETLENALSTIPAQQRESLASHFPADDSISLHQRIDSKIDGATKLVFATAQGLLIESVLMRAQTGRTTICISSQVGCAAKCQFCATGSMGMAVNLSAREIIDQVRIANRELKAEGRSIRNVVFMGMGEPFHNVDALYTSVKLLRSPHRLDLVDRNICVSTVGIPNTIEAFSDEFPNINLALSLHSALQGVREFLIPLAKRYPISNIQRTMDYLETNTRGTLMIEYLMLGGINDRQADFDALDAFMADRHVHINLIPYNHHDSDDAASLQRSEDAKLTAFSSELKHRGHAVTRRYSMGADIGAACGQLIVENNRARWRELNTQ